MPGSFLAPKKPTQVPDFWNTFGHSYLQIAYGTLYPTGRLDALFRAAMDVEFNNWRGFAKDGAILVRDGRSQGGYARVLQEMTPARQNGPYVNDTGSHLFCWGVNDIGNQTGATQTRTAWKNCLRAVISRARASAVFEDSHASVTYGAAFTQSTATSEFSSGSTVRGATSTTNANLTITLPSDYKGETVAICLVGQPGAFGGSATFSGTAGVTGTISNSTIGVTGHHAPVVRRITNLTSANAGQTIILTVNSLDASGTFFFDCWWLEAQAVPPVLVCNIARLTATGYALYGSWTGTEAAKDTDVDNFNADLVSIVAEFDSMVQIVDIDSALNKDATLYGDGLHPNELGAARCADACLAALDRLQPTSSYGYTAHLNPSSERGGQVRRSRIGGLWYTSDTFNGSGSNYTAVAGDMFAIPFYVTGSRERYIQMQIEAIASVTGTAVRWGIYDDRKEYGYPQTLVVELTSAGAFTITTGSGAKPSPASGTGSLNTTLDPGLFWLAVKFTTVGVTHTFRTVAGPSLWLPNCTTAGLGGLSPSGWKLTSQGTGAFPVTYVGSPFATATLSDNCPAIFLKLF